MNELQSNVIIGVDGGGTGCRVAIGTLETGVLTQAEGGRANVTTDIDLAMRNVVAAIDVAAKDVGIAPSALAKSTAHLGLAGAITATQRSRIAQALPFAQVTVTDDRATTLAGAFSGQEGYLLAVGTGTIVATNKGGAVRSVGGWGLQISDQGSGAWLGRAALEHVLLCYDGLEEWSDLSVTLFAQYGNDPSAVVDFATIATPGDYGTLAPTVIAGAIDGDTWAQSTLQRGADYMARGLAQLGFQPGDALCLLGGLGPHYARYLPPAYLAGKMDAKGSALDGAFALARVEHQGRSI